MALAAAGWLAALDWWLLGPGLSLCPVGWPLGPVVGVLGLRAGGWPRVLGIT